MSFRNVFALALLTACSGESVRGTKTGDTIVPASPRTSAAPDLGSMHYVGTRHGALPAGVTEKGGAVVRIGATEYAISHLHSRDGDMLWLDSIVPGPKQPPEKIVRAELRIPPLERDERLFMASCDVNGRLDARVVAIVVNETGVTKFTKIRQAWRADPHRGRFDVIPVTEVTCEDPGT